jgi:type VI secretion system protein
LCAGIVLATANCSMTHKVRSAFGGMLPVQVTVAPQANEDSPVAVDLVVVYDKKLVDELLKMAASQWFTSKAQFMADHDRQIAVQGWEWVPGQKVDPLTIDYRAGAKTVILFADYHTDGDHRFVVQPQQPFRLILAEREMTLEKIQ